MWTFPIADGCASKAFLSVVTLFLSSHNPNTLLSAGADTPHVYFRGKQHWQCFKREKLLLKPNKFYFVCFYAKKVYLNLLHKLWWRRRWLLSLCVCVTNGNTADASHYDHLESLDAYFVFFLSFVFFRSIKMMLCNLNSRALFRRRSSHCRILWFCQTKCISLCMQLHGCQLVGYHKQELIDRKCHNDRSTRRTQCARNESRFVERSRWCTDANKFLKH